MTTGTWNVESPGHRPLRSFSEISTWALVSHLSTGGTKIARRTFWARLRRFLLGNTVQTQSVADAAPQLAFAVRGWQSAASGWREGRVRTMLTQIPNLRSAVEQTSARFAHQAHTQKKVNEAVRRAWADARLELRQRLDAITDRLTSLDQAKTPASYYWLEMAQKRSEAKWQDEHVDYLAGEIRRLIRAASWTRANVKLLMLHAGDLRWLARRGRRTGVLGAGIPSDQYLMALLDELDAFKARLENQVRAVYRTRLGTRLQAKLALPQNEAARA